MKDHEELYNKTIKKFKVCGLTMGKIHKQLQALSESVHDFQIPKDLLWKIDPVQV